MAHWKTTTLGILTIIGTVTLAAKAVLTGGWGAVDASTIIQTIIGALVGMGLSMGGMYVLVSVSGFYYIYARVSIAAFVGIWNYLMNLHLNFKVAGKH